jgi:Winged helix DNA-binding domain
VPEDARRRLLAGQCLDRPTDTAEAAVRSVGVLQAQVPAAAALGIRARTTGLTAGVVASALVRERSLVRTWLHRGTLHLAPTEDLGWLLGLLGERHIAATARRHAELGLTEAGALAVERILADEGPLERAAIGERLAEHGFDPAGQRLIGLIRWAALRGRVLPGPGDTFVRLEDWLGGPPPAGPADRDAAMDELARRHLAAYGVGEPRDLATWAGIPVPWARAAFKRIDRELVEVDAAGRRAWVLARAPTPPPRGDEPVVSLLPAFDAILFGHRDRSLVLSPEHHGRVQAGGGWLHPIVLVDGRAVATWRREAGRIVVEPFDDPPPGGALAAEIADVERFSAG